MSALALLPRAVSRPTPALRPAAWVLAAGVVAAEIPYPLVHGGARDGLTVATVLVFCAASLADAAVAGGARAAAALLAVAGLGGFAAEAIGVHTGVPFGRYAYTGGLGVTWAGVPLVVPLAWVMMTRPALAVAARLTGGRPRLVRVAAAAWALASWDVFLDPQMVAAGHWRWADPTPHLPGIGDVPLSNFGGWLLVAVVLTAVLTAGRIGAATPTGPALGLWVWTWLASTLADVAFLHRPAVAAWGFAAMGVVGVPLLLSARRAP